MIDVALLGIIRRWYIRDHISIREIARRLDISRNTVRRYIRSDAIEPAYPARHSPSSLDEFAPRLSAWLSAESVKSRKQRRTLKQMFLDLRELGYEGSYDRVAAFGRRWKVGQMERVKSASKSTSSASRYKGRGFVQITSEVNYNALNLFLNRFVRPTNLVNQPETLGSDSYLAFAASCWYWRSNDLRRSAKKGMEDAIVEEVGRVINRGPARRNLPEYPPLSNEDRLQKFHWVKKILLT